MLFLSACEQNVNISVHFFGAEKILLYIKKFSTGWGFFASITCGKPCAKPVEKSIEFFQSFIILRNCE